MSKQNSLKTSQTDWARIDAMTDDDIDYSDIPPITDEMWAKGIVRRAAQTIPQKDQDNVPIDKDIIEYFKAESPIYPAKINQLLREFMEARQAK